MIEIKKSKEIIELESIVCLYNAVIKKEAALISSMIELAVVLEPLKGAKSFEDLAKELTTKTGVSFNAMRLCRCFKVRLLKSESPDMDDSMILKLVNGNLNRSKKLVVTPAPEPEAPVVPVPDNGIVITTPRDAPSVTIDSLVESILQVTPADLLEGVIKRLQEIFETLPKQGQKVKE